MVGGPEPCVREPIRFDDLGTWPKVEVGAVYQPVRFKNKERIRRRVVRVLVRLNGTVWVLSQRHDPDDLTLTTRLTEEKAHKQWFQENHKLVLSAAEYDKLYEERQGPKMEVKTVRKKPVQVQAVHWEGDKETLDEICRWVNDHPAHKDREDPTLSYVSYEGDAGTVIRNVQIWTLEGLHEVKPGDWIIKGVADEFYPCKPDIFDATYMIV